MVTRIVRIRNRSGLHTRPAATIVKMAARYASEFSILKDGFRINGKSIIGVMTLAAEQGSELTLEFTGPDEEQAADEISAYFERGFDEAY